MEAETLGPWLGNFFYVLGGLYLMIRMVQSFRRTPSVDVDFGKLDSRLSTVEKKVESKQEAISCRSLHHSLEKDMQEIKQRHTTHEMKLSRQVGAIHERINDVFGELREMRGEMKAKGGPA